MTECGGLNRRAAPSPLESPDCKPACKNDPPWSKVGVPKRPAAGAFRAGTGRRPAWRQGLGKTLMQKHRSSSRGLPKRASGITGRGRRPGYFRASKEIFWTDRVDKLYSLHRFYDQSQGTHWCGNTGRNDRMPSQLVLMCRFHFEMGLVYAG